MIEKMLDNLLLEKEFCTLKMYNFLNKEVINKNYQLLDKNFVNLLGYLRERKDKYLDSVWNEFSIQKNMFLAIVELCDFCYEGKDISVESINVFFQIKEKKFYSISLIKNFSKELYEIYLMSKNKEGKNLKFYKNNNFECYLIEKENDITNLYLDTNDIFFHIILDGVMVVKKNCILTKGDIYFSDKLPLKEKIVPLTPKYKKIIFVVKKEFLERSFIIVRKESGKKLFLPFLADIKNIFNKPLDDALLLEMGVFLIEFFNCGYQNNFYIQDIERKNLIIKIIKDNINSPSHEIVNKLLLELDISISKLYNIFYTLFGISITKYIDKVKMDKVCSLIVSSKAPIGHICEQVGFTENALLNKFSKYLNCTPKNFRKEFCGSND